jgi:hypothetical protein
MTSGPIWKTLPENAISASDEYIGTWDAKDVYMCVALSGGVWITFIVSDAAGDDDWHVYNTRETHIKEAVSPDLYDRLMAIAAMRFFDA